MVEEVLAESFHSDQVSAIEDSNENLMLCQDKIMKVTVLHPLAEQFPLPPNYTRNFLKTLITKVFII